MIGTASQRFLALATAGSILSSLAPIGATAAFTDVKTSTSYSTAIEALRAKGVLAGYADNSFKPGQTINRAEFAKIIANVLASAAADRSNALESCRDPKTRQAFPDVPKDAWFFPFVCALHNQKNIVQGYPDGTFRPEQSITFVEAGKILALAYGQQVQQTGGEWYEPYAKALESVKAIPPSISGLDRPITRGEMAEMLWRIAEKRTDQPTKGLLNIKYPEVGINLAADAVQTAKSCADLRALATESMARNQALYYGEADAVRRPMAPVPPAANRATSGAESAAKDGDYSRTNVQVAGVDEGDIVKTDGTHLYVVRGQKVLIVRTAPPAEMKIVATLDFSRDQVNPTDLYVEGDRLVVIGNTSKAYAMPLPRPGGMEKMIAPPYGYWSTGITEARVYSLADRTSPKHLRTVSFDGSQISTRMIGSKLYLVMNQGMPYWGGPMPVGLRAEQIVPKFSDSAKGQTDVDVAPCNRIAILPHVTVPQYLIVGVVPTDSTTKDVQKTVILGNGENVYASLNALYVANTHWNYDWDSARSSSREETNIYRFQFTDTGTELQAQGKVPGHLLNQFSMDERAARGPAGSETFRIATTISNDPDAAGRQSNNLFILNRAMETVGKIEDIAPGEQIYAARFIGDRAYMVTFRTVDPLFVIDTSDARNPKILGQLKIPGYSNYLHPYDEHHIIGFGKEAVASKDDTNAWYQGMKMAMFDVTDVTKPRELHSEVIGDRGTESPLLHDHKALLFEKDRNLLAFPVTVAQIKDRTPQWEGQDPASVYGTPVFQGAYVYTLTLKDGFRLRGKITHYTDSDRLKMGDYFYGKNIDRIIRSGEHLLTVGEAGVQSHSENSVLFEGKADFPDASGIYYPMRGGATPPGVAVPESAPGRTR